MRRRSAGLGELTPEVVGSYAARVTQLRVIGEQLKPIGGLLRALGPLAPPCIALPYAAMREQLLDATGTLLGEIQVNGTPEQWAAFERIMGGGRLFPRPEEPSTGLIDCVRSLPELKVYWSTAPSKWWGATTAPRTAQGGLAGLSAMDPPRLPPAPSASLPRVVFTRAAAVDAASWASRIWGSRIWRAVSAGGSFLGQAVGAIFVVQIAWEGREGFGPYLKYLVETRTSSVVDGVCDRLMKTFNERFVPEVVQQLTAAVRAVKSAGVNPAALLPALMAADPWSEKPAASIEDAMASGGDVVVVGGEALPPSHPWLALGVFVVGTFADLALGME